MNKLKKIFALITGNKLSALQHASATAVSVFTKTKDSLLQINQHIDAEKRKCDKVVAKQTAKYNKLHLQQTQNTKLINNLSDILG